VSGFVAQAIADDVLPLSYLSSAFSHLKECETESVQEKTLIATALKHIGEEKARALYASSKGFDLVAIFGSKEAAAEMLESFGLVGINPSLVKEVKEAKEASEKANLEKKCDALSGDKGVRGGGNLVKPGEHRAASSRVC